MPSPAAPASTRSPKSESAKGRCGLAAIEFERVCQHRVADDELITPRDNGCHDLPGHVFAACVIADDRYHLRYVSHVERSLHRERGHIEHWSDLQRPGQCLHRLKRAGRGLIVAEQDGRPAHARHDGHDLAANRSDRQASGLRTRIAVVEMRVRLAGDEDVGGIEHRIRQVPMQIQPDSNRRFGCGGAQTAEQVTFAILAIRRHHRAVQVQNDRIHSFGSTDQIVGEPRVDFGFDRTARPRASCENRHQFDFVQRRQGFDDAAKRSALPRAEQHVFTAQDGEVFQLRRQPIETVGFLKQLPDHHPHRARPTITGVPL